MSTASLKFALYVAFYEQTGYPYSGLSLPDDVIVPPWGQTLPGATNEGIYCVVDGVDPALATLTQSQRAIVRYESQSGVRVRRGDWDSAQGAGSGKGVLIAVAAGIVGVIILARKQ